MPFPLVPIAGAALKVGGLAVVTWLFTRRMQIARIDQRSEDALDELPEGLATRRPADRDQTNMTGRFRRVIHLPGEAGAVEIDAAFVARLRARRL